MGNALASLVRILFFKKEMKLMMVGLPGSGKKTILNMVGLGTPKTDNKYGLKLTTVRYRDVSITVFDLEPNKVLQSQWNDCLKGAQGLVFVVDSKDTEKIPDAKWVLDELLKQQELRDATLLVLANKKDAEGALDAYKIADKLELKFLKNRRWYIQSSNAKTGLGIYEGLDWLSNNISSKA